MIISIERFLVIKYPCGPRPLSKAFTVTCSVLVWILGCLFAALPLLTGAKPWDYYSSNSVCCGLPLLSKSRGRRQCYIAVSIAFKFPLCLCICAAQIAICRATISKLATFETSSTEHEWCETHKFSITDNAATCSHDLSLKMERDLCVARNLAPITFTNLLCWLIVGAMRLVSLGDDSLGGELTSWATVFVLPINAALNPVFYSLPVIRNYLQNNSRTYGS